VCGEVRAERNVRVARCRREDLGAVAEVLRACPEAGDWTGAALEESLAAEPGGFLVAWESEELAGFIVGRHAVDQGEILNVGVAPKWRRRGVGEALVRGLLGEFCADGVTQMFLEVRASNGAAMRLYEGMGFRKVGSRVGYYREPREDAWILEWRRGGTTRRKG